MFGTPTSLSVPDGYHPHLEDWQRQQMWDEGHVNGQAVDQEVQLFEAEEAYWNGIIEEISEEV